jgi:hypothetical protein
MFSICQYNLPDRRQVNGIAQHMRITMDILNSEICLAKIIGHHEERQVLVYIKTVPLVCDDVEKKYLFFRATKKKKRQKVMD